MVWGIDSRLFFFAILGLVILERLFELRLARRNVRRLLARGGFEVGSEHYPWMVRLHACFLIACSLEVGLLDRPFIPVLGFAMLGLLVLTMAMRYWVIYTLGDRWTTRVLVVPGEPRINRGPYRFFSHPNYLAVILEVLALSLIHSAWASATLFSLLNLWLLTVRVQVEERALRETAG